MKTTDLDEGKRLAAAAMKWWRTTIPPQEHQAYSDEPIPKLNAWLNNVAFPELAKGGKRNVRKAK